MIFEQKSKESKALACLFKSLTEFIIQIIEWKSSKKWQNIVYSYACTGVQMMADG